MRKVVVFILVTSVLAGLALAKDEPRIRRLSEQEIAVVDPGTRQDCLLGNLNPGAWAIGGWFTAEMITDDFPTACTSFNDWGSGWHDLVVDFGFPGNLVMWADAMCCEDPIAQERRTWGDVKSLFR